MLRWLFVTFLIAHGLVHIAVWGSSKTVAQRSPGDSWVLGEQHGLVIGLVIATVSLFTLAGLGLMFDAGWWKPITIVASAASLALVGLFPGAIVGWWMVAPITIDVGLIVSVAYGWPAFSV
jgi:hypothetical protein